MKRIVDKDAGKEKVYEVEGRCRVTGETFNLTRFHVVPRDCDGDDVDDNFVPIVWRVHMAWEHDPDGKRIWGPQIWATLRDAEQKYALEKRGRDWVRRYYYVDVGPTE